MQGHGTCSLVFVVSSGTVRVPQWNMFLTQFLPEIWFLVKTESVRPTATLNFTPVGSVQWVMYVLSGEGLQLRSSSGVGVRFVTLNRREVGISVR